MVRVLIVEDDEVARDALIQLVNGASGCECIGAYVTVEAALAATLSCGPDVTLLDINLPGVPGAVGVRQIVQRWPAGAVLMLTVSSDNGKIFESICNGAVGYLLKTTPLEAVVSAIREAAAGGAPMSPGIARRVVTMLHRRTPAFAATGVLTPQERRLLQLLAEGHSYQDAGRHLGVTVNTVRSHVRAIYEKLHVRTMSHAVHKGLRQGFIQ